MMSQYLSSVIKLIPEKKNRERVENFNPVVSIFQAVTDVSRTHCAILAVPNEKNSRRQPGGEEERFVSEMQRISHRQSNEYRERGHVLRESVDGTGQTRDEEGGGEGVGSVRELKGA